MKLLISDANILIDFNAGEIIKEMFQLNCKYQFAVPDILFEEELKIKHKYLKDLGLIIMPLNEHSVELAYNFSQQYKKPSLNDRFALTLAKQEQSILLTGDKPLREAATKENVKTHGSIWLIEQMIKEKKNGSSI